MRNTTYIWPPTPVVVEIKPVTWTTIRRTLRETYSDHAFRHASQIRRYDALIKAAQSYDTKLMWDRERAEKEARIIHNANQIIALQERDMVRRDLEA
jgi:hypothetical protein